MYGMRLLDSGCEDGVAYLYSLASLKLLQSFLHDQSGSEERMNVECVGFAHPSLTWVATGGLDNTLRVWERTGFCRCSISHNGGVVSLQWHPQLPLLCTASLDCAVRLVDARNGHVLRLFTGHLDNVTSVVLAKLMNKEVEGVPSEVNAIVSLSEDASAKVFFVDFASFI